MTFLNSKQNFSKDLDFIQKISTKLDQKILSNKMSIDSKIEKLSSEELQDIKKIVSFAEFLLCKYEDKKEIKEILDYFVSIIHDSADSIESVDDEVSELIISSEDSINKIKEIHTNISEKYDLKSNLKPKKKPFQNSPNNLTKLAIEINSNEYQQNSKDKDGQVI